MCSIRASTAHLNPAFLYVCLCVCPSFPHQPNQDSRTKVYRKGQMRMALICSRILRFGPHPVLLREVMELLGHGPLSYRMWKVHHWGRLWEVIASLHFSLTLSASCVYVRMFPAPATYCHAFPIVLWSHKPLFPKGNKLPFISCFLVMIFYRSHRNGTNTPAQKFKQGMGHNGKQPCE